MKCQTAAFRSNALFVCTGNAGRSQMAAALLERALGDTARVFSAGVAPWDHLHPVAIRLMAERGISLEGCRPKHLRTLEDVPFDLVVTLGDQARDGTPPLAGNPRRIHWDISDPADADGLPCREETFRTALASIETRLPEVIQVLRTSPLARQLHLTPGISTCVVRPNRFDPGRHLPLFAQAGFGCIELNCFLGSDDFPWDRPAAVRELARVAGDTGCRVFSVHAGGQMLPPADLRERRTAVDVTKAFIDLTAELGAAVTVIHARPPSDSPCAREELRQTLADLQQHVLPMPCMIGWENCTCLGATDHLSVLAELNPGAFGFVLDNGHSNLSRDTDVYLRGVARRLIDLHLSDNDAAKDQHAIPGRGCFHWDGMVDRLLECGYTGPLMLELLPNVRPEDLPAVLQEAAASIGMLLGTSRGAQVNDP